MRLNKVTGIASKFLILVVMALILTASVVSADWRALDVALSQFTQNAAMNAPALVEESNMKSAGGTTGLSTLCRIGFAGARLPLETYLPEDVQSMRGGWLMSWGDGGWYKITAGMRTATSIEVKQWKQSRDGTGLVLYQYDSGAPSYTVPFTYTVIPSLDTIKQLVAERPGQLWLVGNEIERRDWAWYNDDGTLGGAVGQGEILPEVYAVAYHEIYHAIKNIDPTAKVANGSVTFPSPLRLKYLDQMWNEYFRLYHTSMPVDVWQTHLYLLREKRNDFGVDIPAGNEIDQEGMFVNNTIEESILANKDFSQVKPLLYGFRQWLRDHGQQNKPLILSEMAVNIPDWLMEGAFTPDKVANEFMVPLLDMLYTEKDVNLGYPEDDYRLVQSMWWWSFDMDYGNYDGEAFLQSFNGNLFWTGLGIENPRYAPLPQGVSELGRYWATAVAGIPDEINLRPVGVSPDAGYSASGQPVTVTVNLQITNSGNVAVTTPFTLQFKRAGTSTILSSVLVNGRLEGCGDIYHVVDAQIPDLAPGVHTIGVIVDYGNRVPELNEYDNEFMFKLLVADYQVQLPVIIRR